MNMNEKYRSVVYHSGLRWGRALVDGRVIERAQSMSFVVSSVRDGWSLRVGRDFDDVLRSLGFVVTRGRLEQSHRDGKWGKECCVVYAPETMTPPPPVPARVIPVESLRPVDPASLVRPVADLEADRVARVKRRRARRVRHGLFGRIA
jgi:hypothetical protein